MHKVGWDYSLSIKWIKEGGHGVPDYYRGSGRTVRLRMESEVIGVKVLSANHKSFGKEAWKINKENMALISNL